MDSYQLQCPVCTLFLHIGMNLQTHLDTHPKDQVIKALVNMTLTQQQSNDQDTTASVFKCSKYAPITEDGFTQKIDHFPPDQIQNRPQQVLISSIGYSCSTRTRVFRGETPIQQSTTSALSSNQNVTTTISSQPPPFTNNQHCQKFTPPPPYGSIVSRMSISQSSQPLQSTSDSCNLQSHPMSDNNQRNGTIYLPVENVNDMEAVADVHVDDYTNQTDQNSEYIEHCDEEYLDDDVDNTNSMSMEIQTQNECPSYDKEYANVVAKTQLHRNNIAIRPKSVIYINDDDVMEVKFDSLKKSTEGLRVLSDVKLPANVKVDILSSAQKIGDSFKLEDVFCNRLQRNSGRRTLEVDDESVDDNDHYVDGEEVDNECEMLGNVAEKRIVEIKCEMEIGDIEIGEEQFSEQYRSTAEMVEGDKVISTNRSIIVLPKSPLPSTSFSTTIKALNLTEKLTLRNDLNLTGELKADDKKSVKQISNKSSCQTQTVLSLESIPNDDRMSNIATLSSSIGKTSVIRLASPKKQSMISEPSLRPLLKTPFAKQPKKIVVKFKKPFVPVVEEDANLQPPEVLNVSSDESHAKVGQGNDSDDKTIFKSEENVDQHYPFSPLRQTFTPPPPSPIGKSSENDTNAEKNCSSVVDLCTKEVLVINAIDESVESIVGDNDESPMGDGDNDDLDIEDSIGNSLKCDKKIHKIESNEEVMESVEDIEDNVLQIKIESFSQNIKPAPTESTQSDIKEAIILPEASSTDLSLTSSSSQPTTSSQTQNNFNEAGPSRIDYGLSSFEDFYSSVRLSPIGFTPENYTWNQRFSPQYVPFDNEKNSYMDLDVYKNTNSYEDRAPSTDSLNIRTDEKMPAKGEISEQESNGDVEGSSWSHQMYPVQDTFPRYPSSYDTTVARESWSLSNDQNLANHSDSPVVLPKFTSLESAYINADVKPTTSEIALTIDKSKQLRTRKKYRCPECPKVFSMLKDKRLHLVSDHDYQIPCRSKSKITCTSTSVTASTSISTITGGSNSLTEMELKIKQEHPINRDMPESMNRYLLNYNYNILKDRLSNDIKKEPIVGVVSPAVDSNCYQCMVCKEQFFTIKSYDAHMSIHPAECYTCGKFFNHWLNLSIHLKRHLNIRDYWCTYCNKKFVVRQNLLDHMNTHSGDAPLQCKICSKRFRRYSNLVQHRNRHHLKIRPKEKDFICSCGEVFHSEAKIAWHRETHDKKPKCCPYCRERFMHKNSLSRHVRLSHPDKFGIFKENAVECLICNKKYLKSSLKAHMVLHTKKREFECSICNKSFTSKWNLKQHKWIHASRSSKPFKCNFNLCTKAFIRESEYVSHMNTHKAIKPYTCDHCGCQFARKYNWLRHAREHETPKRYRCDDCGKVFHRAYYLTEHKRSHTGERPFECVICGKTSTTKTNHNKHVKIHHARDPLTAEG